MENNDILIKKIILHIIDNTLGMPVLSDREHVLDNDIKEYISKHIAKVLKDDELKKTSFLNEENIIKKYCEDLTSDSEKFCDITKAIASYMYGIIHVNPNISPADLIFCIFIVDDIKYLGILKFNYKPSYIHFVQEESNGRNNSIIKQKTALPNENQKIEECILINLENYAIKLKEKKYLLDEEMQFYLSTQILECTSELSEKEKIKILNKSTKNFVKKYCNEDISKLADIKNAVIESVDEKQEINIGEITEKVFERNQEMKTLYIEEVEKSGLKDKTIKVNENLEKSINKKQKLVTDNGIEIKLPMDFVNQKEKVEFISNNDGTISILLKNVGNIIDK